VPQENADTWNRGTPSACAPLLPCCPSFRDDTRMPCATQARPTPAAAALPRPPEREQRRGGSARASGSPRCAGPRRSARAARRAPRTLAELRRRGRRVWIRQLCRFALVLLVCLPAAVAAAAAPAAAAP